MGATAGAVRGPGLYPLVRVAATIEALIFSALLAFWLLPGFEGLTTVFGWAHGVGYLGLLGLLFVALRRGDVPFWLALVTFNPLGPLGTVAGIAWLERS